MKRTLCGMIGIAFLLLMPLKGNEKRYQGQFGQDKHFNENYFHDKKDGVFLDIGAHDGVSSSNSWFYEKELGWRGICVEPIPSVYNRLIESRDCICINGAIAPEPGKVAFRKIEGRLETFSGIESNYDPKHVKRIKSEIKHFGGSYKLIEVECFTVNDVLEKHGIYSVDYLSLDTEGGELEILQSIDFDRFYIYAISVENNYKSKKMRRFLKSKGFMLVKILNVDELYINTKKR